MGGNFSKKIINKIKMSEELFNTEDLLLNTPEHLRNDVEQTNLKSTEEDDLMQDEISELK